MRHVPPHYRGLPFIRLVSVILRITAQPVLLQYLKTVVDGPRNYHNVRGTGWDPHRTGRSRKGPAAVSCPARTAHHRLKTNEARSDSGSGEERSKRPATWITDETLRHLDDATRLTVTCVTDNPPQAGVRLVACNRQFTYQRLEPPINSARRLLRFLGRPLGPAARRPIVGRQ